MSLGSAFSSILRRDVAIDPSQKNSYLSAVLKVRVYILLTVLVIVLPASFFFVKGTGNFFYFLLLMLIAKGIDLLNETFYTTYQAIHSIKRFSILKICNFSSLGLLALGVCFFKLPLHFLYEIHLLIPLIFLAINLFFYGKWYAPLILKNSEPQGAIVYLIKESWPLIINSIFFQLSSRISILIIESVNGTLLQGTYSLAVTIITGITAFANSISIVLFPYLTRMFHNDPKHFLRKLNKVIMLFFLCGVLILIAFKLVMPQVFKVIGNLPENAKQLFDIMSYSIIPLFLIPSVGFGFIIIKKQFHGMFLSAIILIANAILFYYLSLYQGIGGSARAFVMSQTISFIIMYIWLRQLVNSIIKKLSAGNINNGITPAANFTGTS